MHLNVQNRGKGIWKLNISFLQDTEYISLIKETIKNAKLDSENLNNKKLTWDFVKRHIRTKSISFGIKKYKLEGKALNDLENKLLQLEDAITISPNIDNVEDYNTVKKEIENIYKERARGSMVRSCCKMIDEYECPTKFFLNLEKSNNKVQHIRLLFMNGKKN